MYIDTLRLAQFRNYGPTMLGCHRHLNIFVGKNGQGKTNLLEAIYVLAVGESFRAGKEAELLQWQAPWFRIAATFFVEESERTLRADLYYDPQKKKRLAFNGVRYKGFDEMPERLAVVLFTPDDLEIVKGSPENRRRFLDRELATLYPQFSLAVRKYRRTLHQRNELLKDVRAGRETIDTLPSWDKSLAELGALIIYERLRLLRLLVPQARRIHRYMTRHKEIFTITYQSSLGADVLNDEREALENRFLSLLEEKREADVKSGSTGIGPHRDDLVLYEDGIDLRTYGSQGEQRTAVLALKLAEIEAFRRLHGRQPILLLDDVMSELDSSRQNLLLQAVVRNQMQTFLTTTALNFNYGDAADAQVFYVKEGKITRSD